MYNRLNPQRTPALSLPLLNGYHAMAQTIAQAVEHIRNTVFGTNPDESATKQGVVLRLLNLCGWDLFDLSQVAPEYTVGNRRVDYALMPGSTNAAFIEVKRLGENLANHQQQLLEYCFQEGVKLAALTNGQTWHLYLPLQPGNWEERRFLTVDLASQEPGVVEQRFIEYLSRENVGTGRAVSHAEALVQSQRRGEITNRAIVEAWKQIIETPDELLVELVSEATERICGFAPDPELVKRFLSQRVSTVGDAPAVGPLPISSPERRRSFNQQPAVDGRGGTLPITLDPPNSQDFLEALLLARKAWIEEFYADGRKEVHRWDAPRMSRSSGVINNLRSRERYRQGKWQEMGIASLRVSLTRPSG